MHFRANSKKTQSLLCQFCAIQVIITAIHISARISNFYYLEFEPVHFLLVQLVLGEIIHKFLFIFVFLSWRNKTYSLENHLIKLY